jgi:hypothetical protein
VDELLARSFPATTADADAFRAAFRRAADGDNDMGIPVWRADNGAVAYEYPVVFLVAKR